MIGQEEELASLRHAFAATSSGAVPGPDCPSPERMLAALRRELPADETRSLVAHTAACASCAEDWRVLVSLAVDRPTARAGRAVWYAGVAAAAALLLVVGYSVLRSKPQPVYRAGQSTQPVVRPLVPEGTALPRSDFVLRWSAGPPGARYDVEVASEALVVLHRAAGLEAPELRVPAAALDTLSRGDKILWRVEVLLPDGRRLSSPTFVSPVE